VPPRKPSQGPADPWPTALRLLARRDYGTAELQRRLLAKGFDAAAVDRAVARATGLGYLDDARYVERLTRTLLETGRAAGRRLAQELRRRGLADELIAAATLAVHAAGSEEAALRDLIARRFAAFDYATADSKARQRVIHYLQRRGFPLDRILTELKRTDS
jgi:regulatory protein